MFDSHLIKLQKDLAVIPSIISNNIRNCLVRFPIISDPKLALEQPSECKFCRSCFYNLFSIGLPFLLIIFVIKFENPYQNNSQLMLFLM